MVTWIYFKTKLNIKTVEHKKKFQFKAKLIENFNF